MVCLLSGSSVICSSSHIFTVLKLCIVCVSNFPVLFIYVECVGLQCTWLQSTALQSNLASCGRSWFRRRAHLHSHTVQAPALPTHLISSYLVLLFNLPLIHYFSLNFYENPSGLQQFLSYSWVNIDVIKSLLKIPLTGDKKSLCMCE